MTAIRKCECGRPWVLAGGEGDFHRADCVVTMSYAQCECGARYGEEPSRLDTVLSKAEQAKLFDGPSTLSQEELDDLLSTISPADPACSNCGDELCRLGKSAYHQYPDHCRHGVGFMEEMGPHHYSDSSAANEHCTRRRLVEVKGCDDCILTWWTEADGEIEHCGHPDVPAGVEDDVDEHCNLRGQPLTRPDWCPLLRDGKPGPGALVRLAT